MTKLREIMRTGFLFAVRKHATVAEAARTMSEKRVGIVAVLDDRRLVGVFSERDAVRRVIDKGRDPRATLVDEVMTGDPVVAAEDEDYQTALRRMDRANVRHLPVMRGPQVVAMVSLRDLLRVELERTSEELRFLKTYLQTILPDVSDGGGI